MPKNQFTSGTLSTHSPETRRKIAATLAAKTPSVRERFMARASNRPTDGCWIWDGQVGANGYGVLSLTKKTKIYAHRASYELFKGPIPDGLTIDHLCRTLKCVNPEHLEAVTLEENSRRAANRTDVCPSGHPKDGLITRGVRPRRYCKECCRIRARRWHLLRASR
jgi:hypothetical protein